MTTLRVVCTTGTGLLKCVGTVGECYWCERTEPCDCNRGDVAACKCYCGRCCAPPVEDPRRN